jgi:hypothetical protein
MAIEAYLHFTDLEAANHLPSGRFRGLIRGFKPFTLVPFLREVGAGGKEKSTGMLVILTCASVFWITWRSQI